MRVIHRSGWEVAAIVVGATAMAFSAVAIDVQEVKEVCEDYAENHFGEPEWYEACKAAADELVSQEAVANRATAISEVEASPTLDVRDPIPTDLRSGSRTREAISQHRRLGRGDEYSGIESEAEGAYVRSHAPAVIGFEVPPSIQSEVEVVRDRPAPSATD